MQRSDLENNKIAILGFGIEGQAVARFLAAERLLFTVFDKKFKSSWQTEFPTTEFISGTDYLSRLGEYGIIFRSPGVHFLLPELQAAKKGGAIITSQIKFFFENCPAKIIAVTGTKGKGTTANLIYQMLVSANISGYLAGNIGSEALSLLPRLKIEDYVVLELSSYQLQDLDLSPHIAVVLAIVPEHLDVHKSFEEYVEAKSAIAKHQLGTDFAVINFDSPAAMQIGAKSAAKKYYIQTLPKAAAVPEDPFAIYDPLRQIKISDGFFSEELHGQIYFVEQGNAHAFMQQKDVLLRGFHNLQNITAAAMVAKILGLQDGEIIAAVKNYAGLEHRLEFVAEKKGVKYYNDSYGTTPQSSLAAIKSFSEPVIAIVGGADKKVDYTAFGAELAKQKNLKAVFLLGDIAAAINTGLQREKFSGNVFSGHTNFNEIFARLPDLAAKGDVVLLAPGSSSFGLFENYKDRGDKFKAAVNSPEKTC